MTLAPDISRNGSTPFSIEDALAREGLLPEAGQVMNAVMTKWRSLGPVRDRMLDDYNLYTLKRFQADPTESLSPEDLYTTNAPRVMAEKIVAFISSTEAIIRANSDEATEPQEEQNDRAEQFAIGVRDNVDRRRRRLGDQSLQDEMAWHSVVRGRYVAARAFLIKDENGQTIEDILPLDPYNLVVWPGNHELQAAAYRMSWSRSEVTDQFPHFDLETSRTLNDDEQVDVWEYYCRKLNPLHDPFSQDPFTRHPYVYLTGTLIDSRWAMPPFSLYMLNFPVVLSPVGGAPRVTHHESEGPHSDDLEADFGESIFAENRLIWLQYNRAMSYAQDLMGKASDPRKKVMSRDGTMTLDEGAEEKGAEIPLSTANEEDVESFPEADASRVAVLFLQELGRDAVAGGLPPQAFGLLDKPLSSVALRQLGNNLEHRVTPRMRAVASCLEGCLENIIAQFETGGFAPITVSGRRFDNQRFANRVITPEGIYGHDPVQVKMSLALPEDETIRWNVANMAMTPTASGEPLASLEWVRENILKMESSKLISRQNSESVGENQSQVAYALARVTAYLRDGNKPMAAIWYDELVRLSLTQQVQTNLQIQQLLFLSQQTGLPLKPPPEDPLNAGQVTGAGSTIDQGLNIGRSAVPAQTRNPQFGGVPFVEYNGIGNQPSPESGYNTTARRQSNRFTGLLGPDGEPLFEV